MLTYLFWPNPPAPFYSSPKVAALLAVCISFLVASFIIRKWQRSHQNPITKKLARTWPTALRWFGGIGLFLVVCRVEGISYVSIRFWWVLWAVGLLIYIFAQYKLFSAKHYEVLPKEQLSADPRDKYLPGKKRK